MLIHHHYIKLLDSVDIYNFMKPINEKLAANQYKAFLVTKLNWVFHLACGDVF